MFFVVESTFSREQTVNAGIIKCPKGSEFAKYCYTVSKAKDKSKINPHVNVEIRL